MEHHDALSTNASDRYLLGEMSEPERFDFEAHYFDCVECAEDVRAGHALARGIRAVCAEDDARRPQPVAVPAVPVIVPRSARWTVKRVLPLAASVAFATIAGYQSLVVIPGLRSERAMEPIVLRPAERGEDQVIQPDARQPYSAILLDVNEAEPGAALRYEAAPTGGPVRAQGTAQVPAPGLSLLVMLPNSKLDQPGPWMLVLRTAGGATLARYPFTLKLK